MTTIPRIIHQSWKTRIIPENVYRRHWVDSWLETHPDWEYRFWTDDDNLALVEHDYPEFLGFYLRLEEGIKRADFARFLYLHRHGGIYVDLDSISLRNHGPLLEGADIVLGTLPHNPYYQIPNAFMASVPGHEFWMHCARGACEAPLHEQKVEEHAGPFRLQWTLARFNPSNVRLLDQPAVYPFDWITSTGWDGGRYYDETSSKLALAIKDLVGDEIAKLFPESYSVTFWTSNW